MCIIYKKRGKHTWYSQHVCIVSVCPCVSLLCWIAVKVVVYEIYLILKSCYYMYNKERGGKCTWNLQHICVASACPRVSFCA